MHVLVPMLLDTTLRPSWESLFGTVSMNVDVALQFSHKSASSYLCDLSPTLACISHLLEAKLLRGRPRRIRATLFNWSTLRRGRVIDGGRRLWRNSNRSGRRGDRDGRGSDGGLLDRSLDRLRRRLLDRCLNRLGRGLLLSLCLHLGLGLGLGLLGLSSGMGSSSSTLATSRRGGCRCWLRSRLLLNLWSLIFHLRCLDSSRLRGMLLEVLL